MAELDLEVVRHALGVARQHRFAEVELTVGDSAFHARLDPLPAGTRVSSAADVPLEPIVSDVRSSLVGYARPAPALVLGSVVREGEVLAVIEALGLANDLESPVAGEVVEVLFESGQPVEFGQVLARVKPL